MLSLIHIFIGRDGTTLLVRDTAFQMMNAVGLPDLESDPGLNGALDDMFDDGGYGTDTSSPNYNQGGEMAAPGTMNLLSKLNIESSALTMALYPTANPGVWQFLVTAGFDGMGDSKSENKVMIDQAADKTSFLPGPMDIYKVISGTYVKDTVKDLTQALKSGTGNEKAYGAKLGGFYEGIVTWNAEKGQWEFKTRSGGFTYGAAAGYTWSVNTMVGPIPITASASVGGGLEMDHKILMTTHGSGATARDFQNLLVTMRINAYTKAFVGIGFDITVLALKFGVFGQVDLTNYNAFLNYMDENGKVHDINGQRTSLSGQTGIEFYLKILFIKYRKILASASFNIGTWETGKWSEIQDWTEKANFPSDFGGYQSRTLDAQAMMMALAALPEFETLAEGMYAEDRDYLAMAERVWGDSGISLFSLDEENKLKNLQSNAYPYSAPLVTGDGELVVFLSDGDSADLNQTQVQFTTMQPDGAYGVPQRVDPDAQYPDSNLSLAGSKSFAVAAWQRQNATLELEAGQEANTDDLNAMMKATEICVGLYKNGKWAVEQLTDNSVTDMAPVVATNGSRAVVVWRRMASTTTQDAAFMNFDAQNALLYRIYDGQKWSEEQVLYNGTMGAVKGLNAAMDQAGNTVVTYTVDTASYIGQEAPEVQLTAEEGGSKTFEIAYAVISADEGRAGATVRLTNDSNLDENPQITTVTLDGEERFLLGWHSQSLDADAGTEVSDIQMRVVNPDGSLYGNFVDNLRQVQNGGGVSIGNAFKFSKAKGVQDLNNLSLIWVSPTAEYREDEAEKAAFDADELFAVKFGQDAGGRVYLSAPLPVISAGENTKVDHFDAYTSGEELKAVLLSSEYDMEDPGRRVNIALENGASIALTEPISAMQTATARYQNALELRDVPILDYADVRHGNSLPIQFTLTNTGKDVLTGVSIRIEGKEAKTTEFNSLNLAPNNSVTLTVYQYLEEEGELISDLRYTVKPTFGADQSVAALTGDIRLQIPDVGISTLETYLEMNGDRMMQMKLYNRSDIELDLLKDRGYSVKIGFYTDSTCNTPADGVRFLDYGDAALLSNEPVFTVDPSKMNLLDHGALICRFAYTLPDTGFQDGDITLYARAWIEDSEGNEISEAYQANNAGSIIFTDPVRRNGGQQFLLTPTLGYDEASGVSTASVTVSNLAFAETEKTGNLIVSLLDESGNVLETLQTLQGPDSLIALGKEGSQTLEFTFGQKGTSLLCSYVQVSEEEADNTLSALTIDGVPLQFDKDTETYSFDVQNLLAAKIQAVASNPGATVQINQEAGQTGSAAGAVPLMLGQDVPETNTITITVTPVAGAPKTYTVTLQALRISNSNVNLSAPEWTRQPGKVPVDVMLEAFDGMPQSVKVKVDNENWGAPGNWLGGSQGTIIAALPDKEGVHTVQVSISDTLGFWTTGELQIGLDQTAPVMEESDVAFEETDLPLFKALSLIPSETDGVTDKQLRVIVHASDALSGIERVTATAGDRVYTAEPVEGQADTYSVMITYGFRGPLVITAYDRAGNQTEVSRYVNVDDEMPTGDVLTGGAVTTQTSATLYGTVTMDDSLLVECGIEYYNAAEEVPNWVRLPLLDLTQKSAFSVRAVGLEPNTAYVYRVYARNLANQMHYGTSNTFTTSACACTVSDVEVTTPLTIEMDAKEAQKLVELRAGSSFTHNGCTSHEGMAAAPEAVYTYEVVSGPATVEGNQLCVTGTGIVRVKVTAVYALDDTTEAAGSAYVNFTVTQKSQPSATGLSYTQPSGAVPGDIPVTVLGVNLGEADEIIVTASHADETVRATAEPDAAGNYVAVLSGLANGSAEESKAYALAVEIDGVPQVLAGAQPTLVLPRAAHSGSAILDFYVEGQLGAAEIGVDAIRIVMPYQTDLTAFPLDVRASWTVSPGAAVTHDEPRMEDGALTASYTVTAENGAAQTYTLRLELQPAPVIAELPFEDVTLETNGGFVSGEIVGEHLENAASITVSLYNADGMEVSRARAVSDPDTGAVTISLPVPENSSEEEPAVYTIGYTIDGVETLTDKTVTVPKKAAAGCELLTFQVEGAVSTEVNAITRQITVTMPYDYPSDTVIPQFTCSAYASVTDLSGGIPVDGTAELTITAENGAAEKTYEIAVVRQATPEVYLMDFANPGNLGGRTLIHVDGVNLANAREIRIEAAATDDPDCVVTAVAQTNGANGFTALLNLPQNYLIHADRVFILTAFVDGVEQTSLDVTQKDIVQPQNNNRILAFTVEGSAAEAEIDEGDGTDSGVITVTMPYNADLTALAPVITVPEGASVAPGSGAAVDLSNPVEYKVSTAGHPDRTYTVQAVRESAPRVTGLEFTPFQTSTAGTLTVRILGENLDHMQDSMQITARAEGCEDVAAQAVRQEDGTYLAVLEIPANTDPLNPVVWTLVVAVDGTEQAVDANTVTVPQQLAIVSFEIAGQRSSTITGTAILVEMPAGTDLTKLVPVITASPGAQVSLPSGVETSFEKPVQITVSMDGNEVTYTVTVRRQSGGGGGGGGGAAAAEEYILQASAGQHGSISPSGALKVPENASQTYAITPDDGYQIADVLVDGESVGAVSSYTFRDIAGAHTIQAFFVPEGTQGLLPFVDVAADDWFYHDVVAAYHGGLLNGTDAVHFSPDGAMTRAMLFTVLARMDGQKTEGGKTWYSAALQWVVSEGISDGSNPNGKLTREQLATILHRYAGHPKAGEDLAAFSDAGEVSGYAEEAVKWAVGAGLITGMGDGTLRPQGGATRAQVAAILVRFQENREGN